MSSFGSRRVETTVTMRCFMPPDSWCAYWSSTRVGMDSILSRSVAVQGLGLVTFLS